MKKLFCALGSFLLSISSCSKTTQPPPAPEPAEWLPESLPLRADVKKLWINVIRGTATDDIWLLANVNLERVQERWVFHFDGSQWTDVTTQLPARARTAVFPISKTDVWAVGAQGTAAHYDGKTWTQHQIPNFYYDFVDVFARGREVWVAAAGARVVHYDGQAWNVLTPPELAETSVHELWGTAQQVLIPVNTKDTMKHIARYRGGVWSKEPVGPGGLTLIHGSSDTDIWALSRQGQGYHFDGTSWKSFPTIDKISLWSLSVAGPDRALAVGDKGTILRWDGHAWLRSASGTEAQLVSVYAPTGGKALVGGDRLYRQK
ncbi:MAG: hypothetical protein JNJ46_15980 [Myxococcales bacterium]|nr:hypothetical protein [Myxococcales bacterium]